MDGRDTQRPVAAGDHLLAQVDELLRCYAEALDVVAAQPAVRWVSYGDGELRRLKVPRLGLFTGYFAAIHIARSLNAARILLVRHAVQQPADGGGCLDRLTLIDALEKALPRRPKVPVHAAFAALVLGIAYAGGRLFSESSSEVEPLRKLTGAVFRLDWGDMWNALTQNSWSSVFFTGLGLTIAMWLLILGPMTSFHLKRLIFDLVPGAAEKLLGATIAEHRVTRDGIYALERETFAELRRRRPRELRFDLVFEAVLVALGIGLFVYLAKTYAKYPQDFYETVKYDLKHPTDKYSLRFLGFLLLVALSLLRLGAIVYTIRLQRAARRGDARPTVADVEVSPAGWRRRAVAACIDGVFLLILWYGIALGAYAALSFPASLTVVYVLVFAVSPLLAYTAYAALGLRLGRRRVGAQTVGKRITGIAVVDRNGETPTLRHLVFRELVAKTIVFGWLGGAMVFPFLIDILWPVRGGDRPALHDKLARTRVVRTVPVAEAGLEAIPALT